jgi:hypothetical protein
MTLAPPTAQTRPSAHESLATAALVLADGTVFWGHGLGAVGVVEGEICFNTAITGYQEILTDPSYAGQIIAFTFPHIGNVGANNEDIETATPAARGLVLRADVTGPSNFRATRTLDDCSSPSGSSASPASTRAGLRGGCATRAPSTARSAMCPEAASTPAPFSPRRGRVPPWKASTSPRR